MGQHRFLLVDIDPVEHVDGLGFGVVVGLDLLFKQRQQKWLEREIAVKQAKLLEHNFVALEAFRILILIEFIFEVTLHCGAGGELALDGVLDGQPGLIGGEFDEFVDQQEKLLCLLRGDAGRRFGALRGLGGAGLGGSGRGFLLGGRGRLLRGGGAGRKAKGYRPGTYVSAYENGTLAVVLQGRCLLLARQFAQVISLWCGCLFA